MMLHNHATFGSKRSSGSEGIRTTPDARPDVLILTYPSLTTNKRERRRKKQKTTKPHVNGLWNCTSPNKWHHSNKPVRDHSEHESIATQSLQEPEFELHLSWFGSDLLDPYRLSVLWFNTGRTFSRWRHAAKTHPQRIASYNLFIPKYCLRIWCWKNPINDSKRKPTC